ncbi:hypothetical protein GIB67_028580 [Kingdonia uniflora]|uniref:Uncharacterized protein n=1 Tax=Kingdonia uniflora TaxID=39325 RepID=A0A7J7KZL9_9MAGN|nr:hypothetical protein GIB67_028580 [Kingdonia uniflora]
MGRGWNPTMEHSKFGHDGSPKKNERNSFTTSGRYNDTIDFLGLLKRDKFDMQVLLEYGEDGNGHMRGFCGHIHKTSFRVTTPLRKVIKQEKSKNSQFADEVVSVRQEFEEKLKVEASKCRRLEERIGAF